MDKTRHIQDNWYLYESSTVSPKDWWLSHAHLYRNPPSKGKGSKEQHWMVYIQPNGRSKCANCGSIAPEVVVDVALLAGTDLREEL